jgi:putative serine/threonine protein kinase
VLKKSRAIALRELGSEPYVSVLCYPRSTKAETRKRLRELQRLGVTALEFAGEKEAFNVPILGKGCVGIVTLAHRKNERVALKIRRVDADRTRMQREAKLLKKANTVQVGPRLLDVSRDFLLMQFIDGVLLPEWLKKGRVKKHVRVVLRGVLEQCWHLDEIGLDHGELSRAPKHIIVSKEGKPVIVDFETASLNRRPSNVTSVCQFLFLSSETAKRVAERLGEIDKKAIVEVLRLYKNDKTFEHFGRVLEVCRL